MKGSIAGTFCTCVYFSILRRNVEFTADDRFDTCSFSFYIKLKGPVHCSVIGYCHGSHTVFFTFVYEVVKADGSVQQTVLGVDMKMDKIRGWCFGHDVFPGLYWMKNDIISMLRFSCFFHYLLDVLQGFHEMMPWNHEVTKKAFQRDLHIKEM